MKVNVPKAAKAAAIVTVLLVSSMALFACGKEIKILLHGNWPDKGVGKAVPNPGYETESILVDEHSAMISLKMTDDAYDLAKAYANELKAAGFTVDAEENDMKDMGIYLYSASNSDGINVDLMYMKGRSFMLSADDGTESAED